MSEAGTDGSHTAAVPGRDRHRVHVVAKSFLPSRLAVVVEQEVSAVDLVASVAVDISDGRDVRGAFAVLDPFGCVAPQHVQSVVKSHMSVAEFDHEVPRSIRPAKVGDKDSLMNPVRGSASHGESGLSRFRRGLTSATGDFFRSRLTNHFAGFSVANLHNDIGK